MSVAVDLAFQTKREASIWRIGTAANLLAKQNQRRLLTNLEEGKGK